MAKEKGRKKRIEDTKRKGKSKLKREAGREKGEEKREIRKEDGILII